MEIPFIHLDLLNHKESIGMRIEPPQLILTWYTQLILSLWSTKGTYHSLKLGITLKKLITFG